MCAMTEYGIRWQTAITGPGYWLVYQTDRGLRYLRWAKFNGLPPAFSRPLYAINAKARMWGQF
jgi:hypothetical protein